MTKVGFVCEEGKIGPRNSTYQHIMASTEGCLRLGTDWIDLLLIHWPDHNTPYASRFAPWKQLKQAGKIRHYRV